MKPHYIGIYKIENVINGKVYIGSSVDVNIRIGVHKNELRQGLHANSYLQRAWNKHGEDNFRFEVILYCPRRQLLYFEQMLIDSYRATDMNFGYNLCPIAGNTLGYKYSAEQKKRLSVSHRGKSPWNKGKVGVYTEETRKKMGASRKGKLPWNKGVPRSEEVKQKISKNHSGKGKPAWNRGIKMPKSVGLKVAESNRRRVWTFESTMKRLNTRENNRLVKSMNV